MVTKWINKLLIFVTALFLLAGWTLATVSYFRMNGETHYHYSMQEDGLGLVSGLNTLHFMENYSKHPIEASDVKNSSIQEYLKKNTFLGSRFEEIVSQYGLQEVQTKDREKRRVLEEKKNKEIKQLLENEGNIEQIRKNIAQEQNKVLSNEFEYLETTIQNDIEYSKKSFWIYMKDDKGEIVTNLSDTLDSDAQALNYMNKHGEKFQKLTVSANSPLKKIQGILDLRDEHYGETVDENGNTIEKERSKFVDLYVNDLPKQKFTGYIALKKSSPIIRDLERSKELANLSKKIFWWGIFLLGIGIILLIFFVLQQTIYPNIQKFILKFPIDLRLLTFIVVSVFALASPAGIEMDSSQLKIIYFESALISMIFGYVMSILALVLFKNLWWSVKGRGEIPPFKVQMHKILVFRFYQWYRERSIKEHRNILLVCIVFLFLLGVANREFWLLLIIALAGVYFEINKASEQLIKQIDDGLTSNQLTSDQSNNFLAARKNVAEMTNLIQQSEQMTHRSENLKTELLTNVSHDLRTPLTSIISYGELLTKEDLSDDARKEYVAVINQKAGRMKGLIESLFEVTKMNHGDIVLSLDEVDLGQLIQQAIAEYSEELEKKKLKMCYEKPQKSMMMLLDGDKIWRVLDNLIGNVVKYAMPGTRVYLKIVENEEKNQVCIQLKNISEHELNEDGATLIERFKRGDKSRHTEGSGLGLAIVNAIVELHSGSLDIQVDGDLFKVTLVLPKK